MVFKCLLVISKNRNKSCFLFFNLCNIKKGALKNKNDILRRKKFVFIFRLKERLLKSIETATTRPKIITHTGLTEKRLRKVKKPLL